MMFDERDLGRVSRSRYEAGKEDGRLRGRVEGFLVAAGAVAVWVLTHVVL